MPRSKKKTLTATKLPSGSYRCRVYDNVLKKQLSFTASTAEEAIIQAQQYKLTHESKPASDITQTLGSCIDRYIDSKSNILSPVTISKYRNIRRSQLSDGFLSLKLARLTNIDAQTEINRLAGIYSAKTVYNASGLISAVMRAFRPEFNYRVTLPRREKKKKDLPTPAEVIKAFKGSDMELIVLLGLWQGFRVSEIRGLKKSDFKDGAVTVNRVIVTVDGKAVEKTLAKTETSKRTLQVPPAIQTLVDEVQGDYITHRTGESIYKSFKRKMKQIGHPEATFHDLRHLNASVMLMLGIPDKYAMERLGQSSPNMIKNVYQHLYDSKKKEISKTMSDKFTSILDTKMDTGGKT